MLSRVCTYAMGIELSSTGPYASVSRHSLLQVCKYFSVAKQEGFHDVAHLPQLYL